MESSAHGGGRGVPLSSFCSHMQLRIARLLQKACNVISPRLRRAIRKSDADQASTQVNSSYLASGFVKVLCLDCLVPLQDARKHVCQLVATSSVLHVATKE